LSKGRRNLEPAPVLGFSEIFESSRPDKGKSRLYGAIHEAFFRFRPKLESNLNHVEIMPKKFI